MADIIVNRPNWLGSEIGLVTKTVGLSSVGAEFVITPAPVSEGTQLVAKSGSYIEAHGLKGLLFQDIDVSNTKAGEEVVAPIMLRGSYIASKLANAAAATSAAALASQGLYEFDEGTVTRPDFGQGGTL